MPSPSVNEVVASPGRSWRVPGFGAHPEYDASLLFCRLARLHIDRARLAIDDPLLFRELQGRCTLCGSKQHCIRELSSELSGTWSDYCPNARTLSSLEAVARCSDMRHQPRATA